MMLSAWSFLVACSPTRVDEPAAPAGLSEGTDTVEQAPGAGPGPSVGTIEELNGEGQEELDETAWFFEEGTVRELTILLSDAAISTLNASYGSTEYVEGDFVCDGVTYEGIGVRLKGMSTFQTLSGKPSLKLRFYDEAFHGEARLSLHNQVYDPSFMAENLSYGFFQEAGVDAPRVGYADVTINDTHYGLYTIVETFDERFTKRNWSDGDGNMYELGWTDINQQSAYVVEEPGVPEDGSNVTDFVATASLAGEAFYQGMQEALNWDTALSYLAVELVIGHWDGYQGNLNNLHMYHEPSEDQWYFVPSSTDLAFGWSPWYSGRCGNYEPAWNESRLANLCRQVPECEAELNARIVEVADMAAAYDWEGRIAQLDARIYDRVEADPRRSNNGYDYRMRDYDEQTECFVEWMAERPDVIRARYGP